MAGYVVVLHMVCLICRLVTCLWTAEMSHLPTDSHSFKCAAALFLDMDMLPLTKNATNKRLIINNYRLQQSAENEKDH